jgi:hypothetical protein
MADRYLRIVLTVIALELFWIGMSNHATPAAAQAPAASATKQSAASAPIAVVITGIDIAPAPNGVDPARTTLPIYARLPLGVFSTQTLKVDADRPLAVVGAAPLKVEADKALPVDAPRPLRVEVMPAPPGRTPGE